MDCFRITPPNKLTGLGKIMEINLRCFSGLSKNYACDYKEASQIDLQEGATIGNLLSRTGIPESEIKTVFVNGRIVQSDRPLGDGDRVALMPATGGM